MMIKKKIKKKKKKTTRAFTKADFLSFQGEGAGDS